MSGGMFTGNNLIFSGGTYIQQNVPPETARALILQEDMSVARTRANISFDKLAERAFPLAFHLADTDRSHGTCFPNTRTKILERIKAWALRSAEKDRFLMWLHGAAGGGKTSVARTFAQWCDEDQGILLGEFFFSRADGTGNQFGSIAPTLAFRMAVHTLKDSKDAISNTISRDPHIFLAPLGYQLKKLVLEPLDALASNGITPYVIILDGLDETLSPEEQETVLHVISTTVYQHSPTLRILICSRAEPTIVTTFNDDDSGLKSISTIVSLNEGADSDADIRKFLVERFAKIKRQLPHSPKKEWPTLENINYLVEKSSGQFIFAATVEKYVGSPKHRHLAIARLQHIMDLSLIKDPTKSPFADLDALYSLILSTRSDDKLSAKTMAVCIQYPKYFGAIPPAKLAQVLQKDRSEMWAIIYELASLLDVGKDHIRPFHASFGDFLYDKSRSHDLCCVEGDIVTDIAFTMVGKTRKREVPSYYAFYSLIKDATPREDLQDALNEMEPNLIFGRYSLYGDPDGGSYYLVPLLRQVKTHVSPGVYRSFVAYFDDNFRHFLPNGTWKNIFKRPEYWNSIAKNSRRMSRRKSQQNSGDESEESLISLQSVSDSSDDFDEHDTFDSDSDGDDERLVSKVYRISDLLLHIGSSAWDKLKDEINIPSKGSEALRGFCDEAAFARSHLPKTLSYITSESSQTKAAIFCLRQITSAHINEDIRLAFAKLLSPSLLRAEPLSRSLTDSVENLLIQHPDICQRLPSETMRVITKYLERRPGYPSPEGATSVRTEPSTGPFFTPMSTTPSSDTSSYPQIQTHPTIRPKFLRPSGVRLSPSHSPDSSQKASTPTRLPTAGATSGSISKTTASTAPKNVSVENRASAQTTSQLEHSISGEPGVISPTQQKKNVRKKKGKGKKK